MVSPSITVRIHPKWVAAFRSQHMNLCCAFSFDTNVKNDPYNVIAWAEGKPFSLFSFSSAYDVSAPTPINTITWTDEYKMAACKHGSDEGCMSCRNSEIYVFRYIKATGSILLRLAIETADANLFHPAKITPNTDPLPISLGGTFTVDKDWKTLVNSNPTQSDPATWLRFHNETLAAGLVFKNVRNRILPVYLLGMGRSTMPPGRYNITPTGSLLIFFSSKKESMSFTEGYLETESCTIKYTGHQYAEVVYTAEGTWEQPTNVSDGEGYSGSTPKL